MDALLELRGLTVELPTETAKILPVNGVSFQLHPRESIAIVGESGCGKTMLGLALMGFVPPGAKRRGEAWLELRPGVSGENGHRVNLVSAAPETMRALRGREMAMVFQEPMTALNPVMRAGDQIAEAIRAHHPSENAQAIRSSVLEAMEKAAIPEPAIRARQFPHQLSGGLRQRVMIAMALAASPRLLILDEPTTALDASIQQQLLGLLVRLGKELGLALLFITHDLAVASQIAGRIIVMYAGRIVEEGAASEVLNSPAHPYTQGLLAAVPRLAHRSTVAIPGSVPRLDDLPSGCSFAPRCALKREPCDAAVPELREVSPSHRGRCILLP